MRAGIPCLLAVAGVVALLHPVSRFGERILIIYWLGRCIPLQHLLRLTDAACNLSYIGNAPVHNNIFLWPGAIFNGKPLVACTLVRLFFLYSKANVLYWNK